MPEGSSDLDSCLEEEDDMVAADLDMHQLILSSHNQKSVGRYGTVPRRRCRRAYNLYTGLVDALSCVSLFQCTIKVPFSVSIIGTGRWASTG